MKALALPAAAALLCMWASSCDSGGDEPTAPASTDVWLSLRVNVPAPTAAPSRSGSRADDSAGHPEEAANADENHIDCSGAGMSLLFFDDRQLLMRVLTPQEMTVTPGSGSGEYDLRFKLKSDYFNYAGTTGDAVCYYMLVANMEGDGTAAYDTPNLFAKTPAQIAEMYASYAMPDQSVTAWMPSAAEGRLIPMSGIARARINRTALESSTAGNAVDLGTLYMQRSMAKIRVLDGIPEQQGLDQDHITAVRIEGCNTRGAYIPVGTPEWYEGTTDVEDATEGPDWYARTRRIAMLNTPQTSTEENKTYDNAYVCYVPECVLTGRQTRMVITVVGKDGVTKQDYALTLSTTNYGFAGLKALARNHIYEFKVEMTTFGRPELQYTVCDWGEYTVTPPTFE